MACPSGAAHPHYIPFSEDQLQRLVDMYTKEGKTLLEIEEVFGVSSMCIRRRLAERGIKPRRPGRPVICTDELMMMKAMELRAKNWFWKDIAKELKISRSSLQIRYSIWVLEHEQKTQVPPVG